MSQIPGTSFSRRSFLQAAAATGAVSALAAPAFAVTQYEQQILFQLEAVLNSIRTAQGRFMQVSAQGNIARGNIFLARPGRMRFEYDPPSPLMIVADGAWVVQVDKELESTAHKRLSTTPLNFILSENVSFFNGVTVSSMETVGDSLLVTVVQQRNPTEGTLTLIHNRNNFALEAWQITDQRGERTTVRLESMQYNMGLDGNLFVIPSNWRN